jgi:hypothetical protein
MNSRIVFLLVGGIAQHSIARRVSKQLAPDTSRLYQIGSVPLYSSESMEASTTVKNKTWCFQSIRRHRSGVARAEQRDSIGNRHDELATIGVDTRENILMHQIFARSFCLIDRLPRPALPCPES